MEVSLTQWSSAFWNVALAATIAFGIATEAAAQEPQTSQVLRDVRLAKSGRKPISIALRGSLGFGKAATANSKAQAHAAAVRKGSYIGTELRAKEAQVDVRAVLSSTVLAYSPTEIDRRTDKAAPFIQFFALEDQGKPQANDRFNNKTAIEPRKKTSVKATGASLRDIIRLALRRHPEIQEAQALDRRSQANTVLAESAWKPKVSFDGGGGTVNTGSAGSAGIVADQLLYDFGRTPGEINAARSGESEAKMRVLAAGEKIAGEVTLAFIDVSRSAALLGAADDYIIALERIREMIRLREEAGLSDKADLIQSGVRLDSAATERISSETALETARNSLSSLVGTRVADLLAPQIALKDVVRVSTDDLAKHPNIVAAQQAVVTAHHQKKVAEAGYYPRVGVQGSYRYDPFDGKSQASLMLTLKGDMPVDGSTAARILAASEAEQAAQFDVDAIRMSAQNEFRNAEAGVKGAVERIKILEQQVEQAEASRDLYLEQYQLSKRTLFELLDAEQQVYLAALARISAEHDRWESVARKAIAAGALTKALKL
ncbi:hypothetical protein BTE77_34825 [Ensifer adhaerens]|nr:hypothetical protein BTE77_34825 [Ensifer adhaerens]